MKHGPRSRIDKDIKEYVNAINQLTPFVTLGSCCGHNKYPRTIVVKHYKNDIIFEWYSGKTIPRIRRFYARDDDGDYYIPEV